MKILITGLGAVGQRHARNLRSLLGDKVDLLAFRQRRTAPALTDRMQVDPGQDPEAKLGVRVFTDLAEALAARPDAVIVSNPTSLHLNVAQCAAEAGCALFIEKPVSHTWEGVPELVNLVVRRRLVTLVGCQWRFHPLLARVRQLIEANTFGRLCAVNAVYGEYMPGWHPYEDYRTSYAARRALGGGVVLTQIHELDYLGWLVGWPESVFAVGGHLSDLEIDVEDTCSALLRCVAGGRSIPVHVHQDYLQKPPVRRCDLVAERGRMAFDLLGARLWAWDATGTCVIDEDYAAFARNDMFVAEMRHFLDCLGGCADSRVPLIEGVRSLAVALAALRSLGSRKTEPVTYL